MKILLVHSSYQQPGGEDIVFDQEHRMLERAGHEVVLYRRSNSEIESYSAMARLALVKRVIWASKTRQDFVRLLGKAKPDLVHVHNTFVMISPSIYSACKEADIPVVQTLHNYRLLCPAATFFRDNHPCEDCLKHSLWQGIRHGCYRNSHSATAAVALMLAVHRWRETWHQMVACYVALTEFARNKFVEGGLPPSKIFVKPNFVHPDPGQSSSEGEYAIFVGRLSAEKRVNTLLAAWKRVRTRIPLLILGGGPQIERLKMQATQSGLSGLHFMGNLSHHEALESIKKARFLVMPSQAYENFPMSIIEAFACRKPVLCSRLGAMQEIVEDGRTGLHITPGDPDDLAEKVEWAWSHPERMCEMGSEARNGYEERYTAEKNYPILMEIYQRAMAACHRQAAESAITSGLPGEFG